MQPTLDIRSAGDRARHLLAALAAAALGLGVASCGGSGGAVAPRAPSSAAGAGSRTIRSDFSTRDNDRDNDGDHNDDDSGVLYYGRAADAADRNASIALVRRYFAAAAAEDGATACSLLVPFIAESVVEDDGRSPGLRGGTCAAVMSKLFRRRHRLLALKNDTLRVLEVRVAGGKALAVLDFPSIPEVRQLVERRVGGRWRLLVLLDGILE
jgi:hypothetical protein